ncbi:MAG: hypothetical protein IKH59_01425 [Bacteroidaceae bacterium]|nr:hypothetical protein [Bacteroidaceae bacterium]
MKKNYNVLMLLFGLSIVLVSCGNHNQKKNSYESIDSKPILSNTIPSKRSIKAKNEPIDPIAAMFQKETVEYCSNYSNDYITKRFLDCFSYIDPDNDEPRGPNDPIYGDYEDGFQPKEQPIIERDPDSEYIFTVTWTNAWNSLDYPESVTLIVALEDRYWKIDNVLYSNGQTYELDTDSPQKKYYTRYDYSNNKALSKITPKYVPEIPYLNYRYVDLGLPSGTLWATMNLGASSPEEFGDDYAWGETTTKGDFSWKNYKWCNGSSELLTKYNTKGRMGIIVDDKKQLEIDDDAANATLGEHWRIPTLNHLLELAYYCKKKSVTYKGIRGFCFTSTINGNSLFLPAGYKDYERSMGVYWSSSLNENRPERAMAIKFFYSEDEKQGNVYQITDARCSNSKIRPIYIR